MQRTITQNNATLVAGLLHISGKLAGEGMILNYIKKGASQMCAGQIDVCKPNVFSA